MEVLGTLHHAGVTDKTILLHKMDRMLLPECKSIFYGQILESWYKFFSVEPKTIQEIMSEKITFNKHILIGKKVIDSKNNMIKETKITKLGELIKNYKFKTKTELETEFDCKIQALSYNSIISAIPYAWKLKLKDTLIKPGALTSFDIMHLKTNMVKLTCRKIYESLTFNSTCPTSQHKWIEYYPFLETDDWRSVYRRTYLVTKDIKLQSLQYTIIHRFAICNYNLKLWNIKPCSLCPYCNEVDTIEHYYYYCSQVQVLWSKVREICRMVFIVKNMT